MFSSFPSSRLTRRRRRGVRCFLTAQQPGAKGSLVADVAASGASSRLSNRDRPVLPHDALCFLTAQQQLPIVPGVFSRRPSPCPVLPNGSATGGDEGSGRECLPCCHGAARCQLRTQTAAAIIMTFSLRFHEQAFDRSSSMNIVLFRRNRMPHESRTELRVHSDMQSRQETTAVTAEDTLLCPCAGNVPVNTK